MRASVNLEDVLADPDIKNSYLHTVDFFFHATGRGSTYVPYILETRIVKSQDEYYPFLQALGV
jgi:hypothetical protein